MWRPGHGAKLGILLLFLSGCGKSERSVGEHKKQAATGGGSLFLLSQRSDEFWLGGASFWKGSPPCQSIADYGCRVSPPCDEQRTESVSAGVLELGFPQLPAIAPADYPIVEGEGQLWLGGENIAFGAEGDPHGVPAFSGDFIAPSYPTLSTPPLPLTAEGYVAIDPTQPLELEWSDGAYADVVLFVSTLELQGFTCRWPSADGHATVPAEILSTLSPSAPPDNDTHWEFQMLGSSDVVVDADGFEVLVEIRADTRVRNGFLAVVQ